MEDGDLAQLINVKRNGYRALYTFNITSIILNTLIFIVFVILTIKIYHLNTTMSVELDNMNNNFANVGHNIQNLNTYIGNLSLSMTHINNKFTNLVIEINHLNNNMKYLNNIESISSSLNKLNNNFTELTMHLYKESSSNINAGFIKLMKEFDVLNNDINKMTDVLEEIKEELKKPNF